MTCSAQRSKYVPDVPTLIESGMPDMVITAWHGLLAPAKTPRPVIVKLNAALNAALTDPEVIDKLNGIGSIAAPGTPEAFSDQIKRDLARYASVVKTAGITPE